MIYALNKLCLLICLCGIISWKKNGVYCQDFAGTPPALQRKYAGDSVTMEWTLPFAIDMFDSTSFYHQAKQMVTMDHLAQSVTYHNDYSATKLTVIGVKGSVTVGFTLHQLTMSGGDSNGDAGWYRCQHSTGSVIYNDSTPTLFIYGQPSMSAITQNPTDAIEGNTVTLTCHAQSTSQPPEHRENMTYIWGRGTGSLPADRHTANGNQLVISGLKKQDGDQPYKCTAREGASTLNNTQSITLDVWYPPGQATASPITVGPITQGDPATLTCILSDKGNPEATFSWTRPGASTPIVTGNTGIYTIPSTAIGDDGQWTCLPTNDVGDGTPAMVNLTVYVAPYLKDNGDNLPPTQTVLNTDTSFAQSCTFTGRPRSDISWTYNGGQLPENVFSISTSHSTDSANAKLSRSESAITWNPIGSADARRQYSGRLQCHASNGAGNLSSRVMNLTVEYTPYDMTVSATPSATVVERDSVTLTCGALCEPGCTYRWQLPGGSTHTQSRLELNPVEKTHHGTYTCTATNTHGSDVGTLDLTVNFASKVLSFHSVPPSPSQGDQVTLRCTVEGRPPSTISLYNVTNGAEINTGQGNSLEYIMHDADCLDSGDFTCTTSNTVNPTGHTKDLRLNVTCPPRAVEVDPPEMKEGAPVGGNVHFQFLQIANPDAGVGEWGFVDRDQTHNSLPDNAVATHSGNMRYLNITNIQQTNFGNYTYTVTGYGEPLVVIFSLTPAGPPSNPSALALTKATAVSLTIQWIAGYDNGGPQNFHIAYRIENGQMWPEETVPDTPGNTMTYKLTGDLTPEQPYLVELWATNKYGMSDKIAQKFNTTAQPTVMVDSVTYEYDTANRLVNISGLQIEGTVTHMRFTVCQVENLGNCEITNVDVQATSIARRKRSTTTLGTISVALPSEGDKFQTTMDLYDGEDKVGSTTTTIELPGPETPNNILPIIIGVVVAVVVVIAIVIIVVLWRKGMLLHSKGDKSSHRSSDDLLAEELQPYGVASANPTKKQKPKTNGSVDLYAEVQNNSQSAPDVYAQVQKKDKKSKNAPTPEPVVYAEVNNDKKKKNNPEDKTSAAKGKPPTSKKPDLANKPETESAVYSQVVKPKAAKDKTKKGKENKPTSNGDRPYVNAQQEFGVEGPYAEVGSGKVKLVTPDGGGSNPYQNVTIGGATAADVGENPYANVDAPQAPKPAKKPKNVGPDGIIYAAVEFDQQNQQKPQQIHRKEEPIEYASVDLTKNANADATKPPKPKKKKVPTATLR